MSSKIIQKRMDLGILFNILLIALTVLGILILQNQSINKNQQVLTTESYQQQDKKDRQKLNIISLLPTFGLQNIWADWIFLQFIQYFGDGKARLATDYDQCPLYFKTIVGQDPRFVDAINYLDVCTSIFAGYPLESIQYMKNSLPKMKAKMEGVRIRPYYIWRSLGIGQLLFQGKPLEAAQSYQRAIDWAKIYQDSESNNFINNLQQSVNFLAKNPDSKMAQIGAWASVLGNNPDEKTLKRVTKEVEALGGTVKIGLDGQVKFIVPEETD
jgi:hypothetical protein